MDPATTAVSTSVAKGIGSAAGRQVYSVLAKRTQRPRVAFAVSKLARREGIQVNWRTVASWLKAEDVRAGLAAGDPVSLQDCASRLTLKTGPAGHGPQEAAARIVELLLDEALRRMTGGDAQVASTRRIESAIRTTANEQRALLTDGGDESAFVNALRKLHPWRAEEAGTLANRGTEFRALVVTLTSGPERQALLRQWGDDPPTGLADAPSEVWCWFACVAADYGAAEAALSFIAKGVERGAPASYWWARAGLIVGTATPETSARARAFWARSDPKHPLALASEAIERGDFAAAEQLLDAWDAAGANDQSIKSILQSAAATGRGDFNRAIAIGIAASESHPEGSGNVLRTAEALLSRGYYGQSDHPLDDYARAFDLAIKARDARRAWLGDSVAPILTAVKASALATNVDQAWRLTQAAPDGSALSHEALDDRLRPEAAILAATMGRFENAQAIAKELNDPFLSHTINGWQAYANDQVVEAESAWIRAWDDAPTDIARLQTASALAPLGLRLPDLSALSDEYSVAIDRIRTVHEVMSASDAHMSVLRARASNSEQLTVLLAERLVAQGQVLDAAAVLEAGGARWTHPLLMRMAAARYLSAGDYKKAHDVAATALSLGGTAWAGRLETLTIQFEALEAQGQSHRSLPVAREMASLAPENLTIRWALVHALVRAGSIPDAWHALTHNGRAVAPRDAGDARTWIGLAAECEDSPEFVQRSLEMMSAWRHDPEIVGVYLAQIYRGLRRHERDVATADISELHRATEEFTDAHPENEVFRKFTLDEDDPLSSLTELMKEQAVEDPAVKGIRERVERGELPLGLAAELHNRTYVEANIRRGAGLVFSHLPQMASVGATAATDAFGSRVVIDGSAASTLSLFDSATVDSLLGSFLALETTDSAFRDALGAQQSLNMLSTMSIGWDEKQERPLITETQPEEAEAVARRSDRVVEILARSERRGWPGLKRFAEYGGDGIWLSALDLALSEQRVFWCDDRVFRQLAASEGVKTFGTVDLLAALEAAGTLTRELCSAVRANLIAAFYVDLDFDPDVMKLAAEIDGWNPRGAAAALTRVHSWPNPAACLRFASEAMAEVADASPTALASWTWSVAVGLVRIVDGNVDGASDNLKILLTQLLTQPWLRPDTLPFVMGGIRTASEELPGITDPLRQVLTSTFRLIGDKHGAPQAAEFLLMLVANLDEEDRVVAAEVILTT